VSFSVDAASIDETPRDDETPAACVERLALMKARTISLRYPGDAVLGADTTVVVDGQMLAKPVDDADAATMLRALSGRAHEVLTGVAIVAGGAERSTVERTTVVMAPISEEEIAWYVGSGEPGDKAGAYAIQGLASRFIPRIDGSYSNVVGLPVATVVRLLKEMGLGEVF
jgi:septum formation protein